MKRNKLILGVIVGALALIFFPKLYVKLAGMLGKAATIEQRAA